MNSPQMPHHCGIVLDETVNNQSLCSPSKTVMILGVCVLYHALFHIVLCMVLQYSCYSGITVTVTPHGSQKFYPLLCSKAQTNAQRSSLRHLWGFDEIKARAGCDRDAVSSASLYIRILVLVTTNTQPRHHWCHSKQGSPNLREDLLFQGMGEDDVQHSTGEKKKTI